MGGVLLYGRAEAEIPLLKPLKKKKIRVKTNQRFTEKFNLIIVKSIQDLEAENEPSTVHTTHGDGE